MPNTYIKPSIIHGLGLFAGTDIPAGTEIVQGKAKIDHTNQDEWIKYNRTQKRSTNFIGGWCMVNHADEPNTHRAPDGIKIYASRDIKKDEEITENYHLLPDENNPFKSPPSVWTELFYDILYRR